MSPPEVAKEETDVAKEEEKPKRPPVPKRVVSTTSIVMETKQEAKNSLNLPGGQYDAVNEILRVLELKKQAIRNVAKNRTEIKTYNK